MYYVKGKGWEMGKSYKFDILHSPDEKMINVKIWEGSTLVVDSGNFYDKSSRALKGGRLGVYCDSQEDVTWAALEYK